MASSVPLGSPLWLDGQTWTSLLQRQFDGGAAVWDANTSSTAVNPLGGVFMGPGNPLEVTALASPAMSVQVNAGYVAITHPTQGHGVYLFGLAAQATLTVASNGTGSSRTDIVVARVHDNGNSTSYCDVEIITGSSSTQPATPAYCLLLATVTVASGASSITSGNITDKRTYTVAPGGILPASASNVPVLAEGQVTWDTSTGQLLTLAPAVISQVTFHTSGTWTCPAGVTSIYAECWGGGGGGGGAFQDQQDQYGSTQGGAGGGGGEYAANPALGVTPAGVYELVVGQAGLEGHAGGNGYDGSSGTSPQSGGAAASSTFTGDTQTVTANGGQGGECGGTNYPNQAGAGGYGSAAPIHFSGGYGGIGSANGDHGSGGGGGASGAPGAAGGSGGAGSGYSGGHGGTAGPGGASGGAGAGYAGYGAVGPPPGGGGGGGYADSDTYYNAGGAGGQGQVRLTWVIQPAQLVSLFTTDSDVDDLEVVGTSTGTSGSSGVTAGSGSAYGWGIGYGSTTYSGGGFDADGTIVPQIEVEFDADGQTDFQLDAKYQLAVPEAAVDSASPLIATGQCRIIVAIDGTVIDTVYLCCSASSGVTRPGDGGAFTVFTSAQRGTTPSNGTHVATLAVETMNTLSGQLSGAHVGNLKSVGTSIYPFGGSALSTGFRSALVAENCSLRVAGIMLATL